MGTAPGALHGHWGSGHGPAGPHRVSGRAETPLRLGCGWICSQTHLPVGSLHPFQAVPPAWVSHRPSPRGCHPQSSHVTLPLERLTRSCFQASEEGPHDLQQRRHRGDHAQHLCCFYGLRASQRPAHTHGGLIEGGEITGAPGEHTHLKHQACRCLSIRRGPETVSQRGVEGARPY